MTDPERNKYTSGKPKKSAQTNNEGIGSIFLTTGSLADYFYEINRGFDAGIQYGVVDDTGGDDEK